MKPFYILLCLFGFIPVMAQEKATFTVKEIEITGERWEEKRKEITNAEQPLFEDDNYTVTGECDGEFGGAVIFKSKTTGALYFARLEICPLIVFKQESKYVIISSLNHFEGTLAIYEISTPYLLPLAKEQDGQMATDEGNRLFIEYNKKKYEKAFKKAGLIEKYRTYGTVALTAFYRKEELYFIVAKGGKTIIARCNKNEIELLDKIYDKPLTTYLPNRFTNPEEVHTAFFYGYNHKGYIEINNMQITIAIHVIERNKTKQ